MPKAIVDPSELRHFGRVLANTIEQLRDSKSQIASSFNDLHDEWNDVKYHQFAQSFVETMARLQSFLAESEKMIVFLQRKARKGDGYLEI